MSGPQHILYLSSDLITGAVTVGTSPHFQFKEYPLFWEAIYVAGSKVMLDLQLLRKRVHLRSFFQLVLSPE